MVQAHLGLLLIETQLFIYRYIPTHSTISMEQENVLLKRKVKRLEKQLQELNRRHKRKRILLRQTRLWKANHPCTHCQNKADKLYVCPNCPALVCKTCRFFCEVCEKMACFECAAMCNCNANFHLDCGKVCAGCKHAHCKDCLREGILAGPLTACLPCGEDFCGFCVEKHQSMHQ